MAVSDKLICHQKMNLLLMLTKLQQQVVQRRKMVSMSLSQSSRISLEMTSKSKTLPPHQSSSAKMAA
jgi:hypothetical protein